MLLTTKNYRYMDFEDFKRAIDELEPGELDGRIPLKGESFLYGNYEYFGGESGSFRGECFDIYEQTGGRTDDYDVTIISNDVVRLSPHYDSYVYARHKWYRRSLNSLEDELDRYAEYCALYVTGMYNDMRSNGGPGRKMIYPSRLSLILATLANQDDLRIKRKFAIQGKKVVCEMYESHFGEPFNLHINGTYWPYPFISNIMADGEEKYLNPADYRKRELIHFEYLENQIKRSKGRNPTLTPRHTFTFVIAMVLFGAAAILSIIGLFLYLSGNSGTGEGFVILALPPLFIAIGLNSKVNKKVKEYKQLIPSLKK